MKQKTFLTLKNPMVHVMRAGDYRIPKKLITLIFCLTMVAAYFLRLILRPLFRLIWHALTDAAGLHRIGSEPSDSIILALLLTLSEIICVVIYVTAIEHRPLRTAGVATRHCGSQYLIGLVTGFAVFSGAVGIAWAFGALRFAGRDTDTPWATLLVLLLCWMIQGFSEEICFRGWLMSSLLRHSTPVSAVVQSALFFALFHLGNSGISVLAFVNLMLFGAFAAFWFLRTGSIWGPAAMHAVWNFVQGNFYGIKVSGIDASVTVFRFDEVAGKALLNGGDFGMEGGLGVTAVMLIGCCILYFTAKNLSESD